jgi:membrane dipeptidase
MALIVDAHCDLAWNMLSFDRDYALGAQDTRRREHGSDITERNGDTLLGWPDYQRGQVAIVFATLFAAPNRAKEGKWDKLCYSNTAEAHQLYSDQLDAYHRLTEAHPDKFRLIQNASELDAHWKMWSDPGRDGRPVGLVVLMEGADGIRTADEVQDWQERGVRLIGLAWAGTRYAGGTREPGPLTDDGLRLLRAMAEHGFVLDLSHMDERSASQALDVYDGPVVATHVNCLALLPNFPTNRHYADDLLRRIVERDGIVGSIPANTFLKSGWSRANGSQREEVPLDTYVAHIDHVCQLAGDSLHAGIGSDFDGGFGVQSVPPEIDTVADLQKIGPLLEDRGYSAGDIANILGLNWLRLLQRSLPS